MKPKDTFSLNTVDWSVKMLFKWVISSWGWREDRRKLYQSKRRFLRLKRVRIWCQWLRYSGTRLCCASGRSVIDLGSCCQLELGVDCFFSIGVDFVFLVFRSKRKKKGIHLCKKNISNVFKIKVTFYSIYCELATTKNYGKFSSHYPHAYKTKWWHSHGIYEKLKIIVNNNFLKLARTFSKVALFYSRNMGC